MRSFTDCVGRPWSIAINVAALKRIKDSLPGVDLLQAITGELAERIGADPCLLVDILYVLCQQQAESAGVTPEQFGQAMAGDAIEQASDALVQELVDFFPSRRRQVLQTVLSKSRAAGDKVLAAAQEQADALTVDALANTFLASPISGEPSMSAPGSSESTPAPSPSAS